MKNKNPKSPRAGKAKTMTKRSAKATVSAWAFAVIDSDEHLYPHPVLHLHLSHAQAKSERRYWLNWFHCGKLTRITLPLPPTTRSKAKK